MVSDAFFRPLLCNSKPALFFKLKFSRLLVHNVNLCLSGFSLNTGTHEKKSWVISIRNGGCCNLFYVHFFTRIFFFFPSGRHMVAHHLNKRWGEPLCPCLLVSASLCCGSAGSPESAELDTAPLVNPLSSPHWISVKARLGFPMGGFLRAQAGLKFGLKELVHLDLTFRSLGSQSVVLATDSSSCSWGGLDDIWFKFWLAEPVNMKVSSLLTLEETVAWSSDPVLNHKLKCTGWPVPTL